MPTVLRKAAPLLLLAGVALMPRAARRATPPASERPPAPPAGDDRAPATRSEAPAEAAAERGRGRQADSPHEIPPRGWKDILIRTWKEFREDQIPLVAAGVTFYALLALFPALAAFVGLYGLVADVADAREHLHILSYVLPGEAVKFLGGEMVRIAEANTGGLSLAFLGGLLLAVWSADGAMRAIIAALNIAYEETEERSLIRKTLVSLGFTVGVLLASVIAVLVLAAPAAMKPFVGEGPAAVFAWISRPLLVALLGVGLALLYRFGPSRDEMKWRWLSWGSAACLVLWIAASAAFSAYVANFGHYEKTYGSLGAAVGLMMWIYVSTQVVLFGAELNSEIEHQTMKDTTVGPPRPLGQRGAKMADTVGAAQD
jgi:membrane protein